MFVVPDTIGAVQVSAELNLDDFDDTVALVYNLHNEHAYDFFAMNKINIRQGRVSGGEATVLDEASVDLEGWQTVRAVGDGTHFRGDLGEKLVTHPHADEAPPGWVGLRMEVRGTVHLRSVRARAL